MDDLVRRLGRAQSTSTLDLTKGYWLVLVTPEAWLKTAFGNTSGHWQYRVLSFAFHGAPATFQQFMDVVLWPHCQSATTYIDYVLIHSITWQVHLHHLKEVLGELYRAGLATHPHRCHLGLMETEYLGLATTLAKVF